MKNSIIVVLCLLTCQCYSQSESIKQETMNKYLLQGKFTAQTGMADELAGILIEAAHLVSTAQGCQLYIVSRDPEETNVVYVTEIWDTKEDHDNSLQINGVRNLIMKAMPMIDGRPEKGQELEILGGIGIGPQK